MTGFYALIKEQEAITFLEKPCDSGGRPDTEKEQTDAYETCVR